LNPRVIITAPAHAYLEDTLVKNKYDVLNVPAIAYEDFKQVIKKAEGVVVTTRLKIDKEIIDAAPKLKWIGRLGSGWN
jgi:D-3-phosphoglycerate dehydrogenase